MRRRRRSRRSERQIRRSRRTRKGGCDRPEMVNEKKMEEMKKI